MQYEVPQRPLQAVQVGAEVTSTGGGVGGSSLRVAFRSAVGQFDVDIAEEVCIRAEVATEHPQRDDEQDFGRVGAVLPCTFQQGGNKAVRGTAADRFAEAATVGAGLVM